jgi:hypothetical protein
MQTAPAVSPGLLEFFGVMIAYSSPFISNYFSSQRSCLGRGWGLEQIEGAAGD